MLNSALPVPRMLELSQVREGVRTTYARLVELYAKVFFVLVLLAHTLFSRTLSSSLQNRAVLDGLRAALVRTRTGSMSETPQGSFGSAVGSDMIGSLDVRLLLLVLFV